MRKTRRVPQTSLSREADVLRSSLILLHGIVISLLLTACTSSTPQPLRLRYEPASSLSEVTPPQTPITLRVRDAYLEDNPYLPYRGIDIGFLDKDIFQNGSPIGLQRSAVIPEGVEGGVPLPQVFDLAFREALREAGYNVSDNAPVVYDVAINAFCEATHLRGGWAWSHLIMGLAQCDVSLLINERRVARLRITKRTILEWFVFADAHEVTNKTLSGCMSELVSEAVTSPLLIGALQRVTPDQLATRNGTPSAQEMVRVPYGEAAVVNALHTEAAVREFRAKMVRDYEVFRHYGSYLMPMGTGFIDRQIREKEYEQAKQAYAHYKAEIEKLDPRLEVGDFWEECVPVK